MGRFKTRTTNMHKKKVYRPISVRIPKACVPIPFALSLATREAAASPHTPGLYTYSFVPLAIPPMTRVGYAKSPRHIDLGVGFGGAQAVEERGKNHLCTMDCSFLRSCASPWKLLNSGRQGCRLFGMKDKRGGHPISSKGSTCATVV